MALRAAKGRCAWATSMKTAMVLLREPRSRVGRRVEARADDAMPDPALRGAYGLQPSKGGDQDVVIPSRRRVGLDDDRHLLSGDGFAVVVLAVAGRLT